MKNPWSRATKLIIIGVYTLLFAVLVYAVRPMLTPLLIGILLAYLLNPLVRFFVHRLKMRHDAAVLVTFVLFFVLLVAIPSSFTSLAIGQINLLIVDVDNILSAIAAFVQEPIKVGQFVLDPPRETVLLLDEEIRSLLGQVSTRAINSLRGLGTNFAWLIIIIISTFYLLKDGHKLRDWFMQQLPGSYLEDVEKLLDEIDNIWGTYLRGQVILAILIGLLTGVTMGLVGLRGALVVGIIAGVLDLIPSLGPLVGGAISAIIALLVGSTHSGISNLWFAVIVTGIFFLIQQFENLWLAPRILGRRLKLHPAVVVIGVLGALVLSGILGAFVIIPLIASFANITRYVYAKLLDRDPWAHLVKPDEDQVKTSKSGKIVDDAS